MTSNSGFTTVNDAELYFEVSGEGESLVLIHGGLVHSDLWSPNFDSFARHFRTVRYDARQHGRSLPVPGSFSHHQDLHSLMETLETGPAHLVGLSMGGGIALEAALEFPELVRSLTLVGAGTDDWAWSDKISASWDAVREAYGRGDLEEAVEVTLRTWTDGPGRSHSDVDPSVRNSVREMTALNFGLPDTDSEEVPLSPPPLSRLTSVSVPTLVILGEEDVTDILEIGRVLTDGIDGAKQVRILDAAHHLNMEHPHAFEEIVFDFLGKSDEI